MCVHIIGKTQKIHVERHFKKQCSIFYSSVCVHIEILHEMCIHVYRESYKHNIMYTTESELSDNRAE